MAIQNNFKRYEIKYKLTLQQKTQLQYLLDKYMKTDKWSFSTIRNIYFDTENYQLIRNSLEKPHYKEKLRMRSYKTVEKDEDVFVEIKKKYDSVVYKRRLSMPEEAAMKWILYGLQDRPTSQIGNEIEYFCEFYQNLIPSVFLSYDRAAYSGKEDGNFRLTLDTNILVRTENMRLIYEPSGTNILKEDEYLMEVKTTGAMPLWLVQFLSDEKIYKTSFSKYGFAYQTLIFPQIKREILNQTASHFATNTNLEKEKKNYDKLIQWAI